MSGLHKGTRDYKLDSLTLTSPSGGSVSLMKKFISCSIYESIHSNTLSCEITILDTANLPRHMPIIGQKETLSIKFKMRGAKDKDYKFKIYAMRKKLLPAAGRKQVYVLDGTSEETFKDIHTKVSRSYYDSIENIIQSIYDDYLKTDKELHVDEPTQKTKKKIIIPNWSPLTAINWLVARAVSAENPEACNYVFYEDYNPKNPGFHLTTLEKLVKEAKDKPKMEYLYYSRKHRSFENVQEKSGQRDVGYEFRNIEGLSFSEPGNRLEEIGAGMWASRLLTHDIVRKHYEIKDFNLKKEWDGVKHVEKEYPIIKDKDEFSSEKDTVYDFKPKHKFLNKKNRRGGKTVKDNDEYEKWFLKRKSLMKQYDTMRIYVNVSGDTRRKCGDIVAATFEPLEPGKPQDSEKIDKYITTKYMVTSVRHFFQQDGGYEMDMELSKDSVQEPYPSSSIVKGK